VADLSALTDRVERFLARMPPGVTVLAAVKGRSPDELRAAIAGGIRHVGQNYVQEAGRVIEAIGRGAAEWHLIGHLQRNKVRDALRLFDAVQTVDSLRLAEALDREALKLGRIVTVLIEVNSAREPQKAGVLPENLVELVRRVAALPSLCVHGLMTMGPQTRRPEHIRPHFAETKRLFDEIAALCIPGALMDTLSMGMSDSYDVAIEEGATMIRLGTILFGPREAAAG